MSNGAVEGCAGLAFIAGLLCIPVAFFLATDDASKITWMILAIFCLLASLTLATVLGVSYLEEIASGAKTAGLKREAAQKEQR